MRGAHYRLTVILIVLSFIELFVTESSERNRSVFLVFALYVCCRGTDKNINNMKMLRP